MSNERYWLVRIHYSEPAIRHWVEETKVWAKDGPTAVARAQGQTKSWYRYIDSATVTEAP